MTPLAADPHSDIEAQAQRQKTALLFRNAGIAQLVSVVNAALLAYVNASLQVSAGVALTWWCLVAALAAGRYLLARRFAAAGPDAAAAMTWRQRYVGATAMMAATWGAGAVLFMWNAPDGVRLFAGLVLAGMVAGSVPLLASVPAAFKTFAALVGLPMAAVLLLQADSPLLWAFGAMSLIFLAAVLLSARYLHETLDVAIRLGLEQARLADRLKQARDSAQAALAGRQGLEETVRNERDFAESLIDTAQAIVLVLDPEGQIVRFNRYLEDISGYRLDEVRGADWFSTFLPAGDQEAMRGLFEKALGEVRLQANINTITAKDGREILVEWRDRTLRDAAGHIVGLLAIGQDVTQREELAQSQRLLKAAVEQSNSSIVVTDADARIIFVNAGFIRTTGYSLEEVMGRNPRILKSGQMTAQAYEELWASIASGKHWHGEICNRKKSGELYWEAAHISPIANSDGRITHYLAVKDDITQRKQAEAALQEQKNFLETILENEPECVAVVSVDGMLRQINNAGLTMLGADSVKEINARGLVNFVVPEHRPAFMETVWRVFEGQNDALEFQVQTKQGPRRWLETHAAPLRDGAGKITYLLAVTRDVTRRREAEERLALSLRGADLALSDWDIASDELVFGEGWTKLLGYRLDEFPSHLTTFSALVNPEDESTAHDALIRHLKGETPILEAELRMRHREGRWVWVLLRGMAVERAADGRALRLTGTAMDITGRKQTEAKIARLSQWNELLLNSAGEGIYGVDQGGLCTFMNPAALLTLGFDLEEVLGKHQHHLFHHHRTDGSPYPQEDCPVYRTLHDGIRREVEEAFVRKNGEVFPVHLIVTPMHEDGQLVGAVAVFQDISRRKALEQELTRLATTDALTGVANRRRFLEQMETELARTQRFRKPAAFLMLDVDHFKKVNDSYGHATGDAVLRHLAELSRLLLRRVDLFGRLGGEEFGILLPNTDRAGALEFAERFRSQVAHTPTHSSKGAISLTVSIGVAEFEPDDTAPDTILARADMALYRAKEGGRNRVEISEGIRRLQVPPT